MKKMLIYTFFIFILSLFFSIHSSAKQLSGSLNLYHESQEESITVNNAQALKFNFQGDDGTSYAVLLTDKYGHKIATKLTTKTNNKQELFTIGLKKGTYTMKVSLTDRDDRIHRYELSYSAVTGAYEQEYNDTLSDANTIGFDKTYKGSADLENVITSNGSDYFKFTLSKNSNVSLNLSKNNLATLTAYILNSHGENIEHRLISGHNKMLKINQKISLKKGTYYIRIVTTQSNTPYAFKLKQSTLKNSEIEENDTVKQANPLVNKQLVKAHIFSSSDVDYYKFTLTKKKKVAFHFILDKSLQLNMALIDSQNKHYHSSTYTAQANQLMKHTQLTLPKGTYYLKISNTTLKYNLMPYQLKVQY